MNIARTSFGLVVSALLCPVFALADQPQATQAERDFVLKIHPLFVQKCGGCHGTAAKEIKGEFDMRSRASLLKGGESGEPGVTPGEPAKSLLMTAIKWQDGYEMPPKENDRLTKTEIAAVNAWITAGAPWPNAKRFNEIAKADWNSDAIDGVLVKTSGGTTDTWTNRRYQTADLWALQPRWQDSTGKLQQAGHPIDILVNEKLKAQQLTPLPRADRRTLLRRLTYDLTGLPPTQAEMDSFLQDKRPQAWTAAIDKFLSRPQYGEQWGKHWLDVVRYADSSGFSNDFVRANAWRYRDYVIRAFNDDKPYDDFVREQVAGDEMYEAWQATDGGAAGDDPAIKSIDEKTAEDLLIAVGFLRSGPWEHTGMSVASVTRQLFLDDVTNSVGVTFMATELRCARCHDHKFDPIPTRDYYSMQAVFAPVQFVDRKVPYQNYENTAGFKEGEARIRALQKSKGPLSLSTIPREEWPVTEFDADTDKKGRAKVNKKRVQILAHELKRYQPWAFSVYSGRDRGFSSTNVVVQMPPDKQRQGNAPQVQILTGGSLETPAGEVAPALLSSVDQTLQPVSITENIFGRRLQLANWLTHPDHPLVARVIVNRVWQYHFGSGLAGNPNNFGATGKKPAHPELLDYLANYLIENDWSLKALHRHILSSQTWQRASGPVTAELRERDPDNQWLARFTPRQLTAEELRDSMLQVSGELNLEAGGLPIRPELNLEVAMQPRHIMGSVAPAYQPSPTPAQRNRRTIHAERIRTLRDPFLEVFNQPGLDTSCERRDTSTITPQAFTLLNSRNSYSRALAWAQTLTQTTDTPTLQIQHAFQTAFGRAAQPQEVQACLKHYQSRLALQNELKPKRVNLPPYVIREMVEEMTGLTFYWVENLDIHKNYTPDLQAADATPETRALADICLVLLNSNEFAYIY